MAQNLTDEQLADKLIALMKKGFAMGKIKRISRDELHDRQKY